MAWLRTPDGTFDAKPCKGDAFLVDTKCPGCDRDPVVVKPGKTNVSLARRWLMAYDEPDRVVGNASAFCTGCHCLVGALQSSVVIKQEE